MNQNRCRPGSALPQGAGLLAVAPLLHGVDQEDEGGLQTRQGPPLLQGYYDLAKLLRKETVRSETASWVYVAGPARLLRGRGRGDGARAGPVARRPARGGGRHPGPGRARWRSAASRWPPPRSTPAALRRMGSSREMTDRGAGRAGADARSLHGRRSRPARSTSASSCARPAQPGLSPHPSDLLALAGLFIVLIAETGRIPVDNPATHLELTMIHEAMVLEYAGADLALVEWASAVKELLYITAADRSVPARSASPATDARRRSRSPRRWAGQGLPARRGDHAGREHQRQAAPVPRARAGGGFPRPGLPGPGHPLPVRAPSMTPTLVSSAPPACW